MVIERDKKIPTGLKFHSEEEIFIHPAAIKSWLRAVPNAEIVEVSIMLEEIYSWRTGTKTKKVLCISVNDGDIKSKGKFIIASC